MIYYYYWLVQLHTPTRLGPRQQVGTAPLVDYFGGQETAVHHAPTTLLCPFEFQWEQMI